MELKKTLTMPKGKFEMRANLAQKEPILVKHFQEINLYERMIEKNKNGKPFYLHDGPAYANGDIHAGHALNKILKDIIVRFHNLIGDYAPYQPGFDTHGLPIENQVVKQGVDRKKTPIDIFRKKCADFALSQVKHQTEQTLRLGCLGNYKDPYITLDKKYEANQMKVFAKLLKDGYIYKGLKPVNWSPSSESALAEAEIEYKDILSKTIYVKFPVMKGLDNNFRDFSFVIWTTTPWTLPANLAIAVNPNFKYVFIKCDQGNLIILNDLLEQLTETLSLTNVKVLDIREGKQLEKFVCAHPFLENRTSLVILGEHVTADAGTGCVHTAPGHGMEDYLVCQKYNILPFCPVDSKGFMTDEAGLRLKGLFYEKANDEVIDILKETGFLLKQVDITHSYPHDWRTGKPLIFRATPQWFFNQKALKDDLVSQAEKVKYLPQWGKIRLINMLQGRDEWCLSRQRAWGVPIPILYKDGEPITDESVINHIISLVEKYGSNYWYERDAKELLPKGYKSLLSKYTKETDIMDVWFDSGTSFLGSGLERGLPFPADVYLEGSDQYRGWYNSSIILSTAYTGISPYKQIITHGFIVDQNGDKFSKSKGNGIDPNKVVNEFGADVLRLWTTTIDYNMAEIKFSQELLKNCSDSYRKIRNTFKFMIANLNDKNEERIDFEKFDKTKITKLDNLLLNRFAKLLDDIHSKYLKFDFLAVNSEVMNFIVNDLSSIYLDYNKDNLYCNKEDSIERRSCQYTMYTIVKNLAIALSPIMPFTMEEVWNTLNVPNKKESIALECYPKDLCLSDENLKVYKDLIELREKANKVIETSRASENYKGNNEVDLVLTKDSLTKELGDYISLEEIKTVIGVSSLSLGKENKATLTKGHKCDRCWNYFDKVEHVEEHHLCSRCHKVVQDE